MFLKYLDLYNPSCYNYRLPFLQRGVGWIVVKLPMFIQLGEK